MSAKQKLSYPKISVLGLQHMFAMFGATILVPLITGLDVRITLLAMGVGTLIFHLFAKGKVPVMLGSSFAFMVGIQAIAHPDTGLFAEANMTQAERLAYATGAIMVAGCMYLVFALIAKLAGPEKFMKFLPAVVTGPTVVLIGLILAPFAINQSRSNFWLAGITLLLVVIASIWGKGFAKVVPILIGLVGAYVVALAVHSLGGTNPDGTAILNFEGLSGAGFVSLPDFMLPRFGLIPILVMIPFSFATIAEHVADMVILSGVAKTDFTKEPGLTRTLVGDGLASIFAGFIGGPSSTTYSENVGLVAMTNEPDPRPLRVGALYAIILAFIPVAGIIVQTVPDAIIGGASFMLYGMIAAVGMKIIKQVDLDVRKNLVIVSVMLVIGLGMRFADPIAIPISDGEVDIRRVGVALAVVVGVILNFILPNKESDEAAASEDVADEAVAETAE